MGQFLFGLTWKMLRVRSWIDMLSFVFSFKNIFVCVIKNIRGLKNINIFLSILQRF